MGVVGLATFLLSNRPEYHINPSWVVLPLLKEEKKSLDLLMMIEECSCNMCKTDQMDTIPLGRRKTKCCA